jgi:hypothetical protein
MSGIPEGRDFRCQARVPAISVSLLCVQPRFRGKQAKSQKRDRHSGELSHCTGRAAPLLGRFAGGAGL